MGSVAILMKSLEGEVSSDLRPILSLSKGYIYSTTSLVYM